MRRHPIVLAVVMAMVGSLILTEAASAQQRSPDLSRLNQQGSRVLGPGGPVIPVNPYLFYPLYPPVFYYPPLYDGPVLYDPLYPAALRPSMIPPVLPPNAPMAPARPAAPEKEQVPGPKPAVPAKDELDQRAEMQKHLRSGNEAFANGEYALALKRYEQAVAAAPLEPMPYFHQAQAQLALGKHAQAVVSIQRGLRLHPKWAESAFQPRALYRDRLGEFDQHLAQLADLIAKNLNDDSLMFLLGYELWFDGKRDEATTLFQRAASLAIDTTFVDRFLKAPKVAGP